MKPDPAVVASIEAAARAIEARASQRARNDHTLFAWHLGRIAAAMRAHPEAVADLVLMHEKDAT